MPILGLLTVGLHLFCVKVEKENAFSGHCHGENFVDLRFQFYPRLRPAVVFLSLNDEVVVF